MGALERLAAHEELAQELEELAERVARARERHPRVGPRIALAFAEARAALLASVNELAPRLVLPARQGRSP